MVICGFRGPHREAGWEHRILDLEPIERLPAPLRIERSRFPEHRLEFSFVRNPSVLLGALGIPSPKRLVLPRQVSEVDIYLLADDSLHLIEVKGITGRRPWQKHLLAANQMTNYWQAKGKWLRGSSTSVQLWSLCPIDWRDAGPVFPENDEALRHDSDVKVRLVFYTVFSTRLDPLAAQGDVQPREHRLLFWREDESVPAVVLENRL